MVQKKKSSKQQKPFAWNSGIIIFYEITHGRDVITTGTPIRFKYQRGVFKFIKMVDNSELGVSWIDCMDSKTGVFRSFYVDQLRGVVKPKKTRKKKAVV